MSGATSTESPKAPGPGGFEETVKDFWASRPRRPMSGRKVAGVAAAVGNRYGIDPVIVRVALVAATVLGGVGVALYVLGWLFFPDERDEVSAAESLLGKGHSSTSKALTVALGLSLFPAMGWTFGGGWFDGGGFIALGLLIVGLYLLHRGRGHANRPMAPAAPMYGEFGAPPPSPMSTPFTQAADAAETGGAPAWDPLGAAPFAWDLPDPAPAPRAPEPPAPKRPKSKVGIATFGVALAAAGAGVALAFAGVGWFSPQHIIGMALAVLGVGMVIGSFVHGGRGLIGLAVPLAFAGVALTAINPGTFAGGVGNIEATPRSVDQVLPVYSKSMGNIDLDLRELPAGSPPVVTTVQLTMGNATIIVPPTADVHYVCDTSAGSATCLESNRDGIGNQPLSGEDFGTDGPGGQRIDLNVKSTMGNAEVIRRG